MKDNRLCITIANLKAHHACSEGLEKTITYFGSDETKLISLIECFKSNPPENVAWALRATTNPERARIIAILWAHDVAERCVHLTGEWRSYKGIAIARSRALGLCDAADAARAAAYDAYAAAYVAYAARAAAYDAYAAAYAAYAAYAAAYAADAAYAARAAVDAAYAADAERQWQYDRLRWYLEGHADWLIDGTRRRF